MNPYTGNEFQVYGVEEYTLHGGFKEGVKMLRIKNAVGLEMTICLSRNSDIVSLTYKGTNLSFLTPNGVSNPCYREPENDGWIKHFFGGFLTTCGYENVGSACEENGVKYPLHGSINYIPVESYSYEISNNEINTNQDKIINIESSEDKNELRETTIRDALTYSSLYFLGDYVSKGVATVIEKVNPKIKLLNRTVSSDGMNVFKKVQNWIKNTKLKDTKNSTQTKDLYIAAYSTLANCNPNY